MLAIALGALLGLITGVIFRRVIDRAFLRGAAFLGPLRPGELDAPSGYLTGRFSGRLIVGSLVASLAAGALILASWLPARLFDIEFRTFSIGWVVAFSVAALWVAFRNRAAT
jgi:hypothetical protein